MTALAPLPAHMTPQVVVSYVTVIAIVVPFHKGRHGCDDTILIVCMVYIQFVLHLAKSLVQNGIEKVPGDDVQRVGRAQGHLEMLPLLSATKVALRHTFEKKKRLVCVRENIQSVFI